MSPSGIHVNKQMVFMVSLVLGIGIVYYFRDELKNSVFGSSHKINKMISKTVNALNIHSWDRPLDPDVLHEIKVNAESIKIEKKMVEVSFKDQKLSIFTRQASAKSPKGNILLLHGQAFTSKNWEDIDTLSVVASMGYRVVAVDLPGYGESKKESVSSENKVIFMQSVISSLDLKAPVIVSPSMSGVFSLPYIMNGDLKLVSTRCKGFVPIAPINTVIYTAEQYGELKLPTVAIYGEKDTTDMVQESKDSFQHIPNHEFITIPGAGHPAYLHDPDKFHTILYHFLHSVYP